MGVITNATKEGEEEKVEIKHVADQVVLLEFWASWCKFCKTPVDNTQKMITDNQAKWGDKVRVVGLSLDTDKAKAKACIEERGLTAFEHYNVKNPMCKALQYFGVKQIPFCALIDKQGKIAFIGHPNWRRLEDDINTLVKGKALTGRGTESAAVAREKAWGTEGIVEATEVDATVKSFMEQSVALGAKQEIASTAVAMQQCAVQLIHKV